MLFRGDKINDGEEILPIITSLAILKNPTSTIEVVRRDWKKSWYVDFY